MDWGAPEVRSASGRGDFGEVIRRARLARGLSQRAAAQILGMSQTALSRLESHGTAPYQMPVLQQAVTHLGIPSHLLGLAETHDPPPGANDVNRREFLGSTLAAAAAPAIALTTAGTDGATHQAATLRLSTTAYRRLDGTTAARDLTPVVHAHLGLVQTLTRQAARPERPRLHAVASETSSLAAWLAWDLGDHGSARTWYGSAIRAAKAARHPLLTAYQLGSLAQFEAINGNAPLAHTLVRQSRAALADPAPAVADVWLQTVEALAHAASNDAERCDQDLRTARTAAAHGADEQVPWPWVFPFTEAKIDACRISCGAIMGLPDWVFSHPAPQASHAKQAALTQLDLAAGHLASGRVEAAFTLAAAALADGIQYRSGRVIERARALRRDYRTQSPPKCVRDFDDRLHAVYMQ